MSLQPARAAADRAPIKAPCGVPLLAPERRVARLPQLKAELEQAAAEVIEGGRYILGPKVAQLEARLAKLVQAPWALAVKSGTDALLIALEALGLGPGAHVIVPGFSFFATVSTVLRQGARPRLVDVCPGCLCLSPHAVAHHAGPLTQAMIPVHLFGQAAAMAPLSAIARQHRWAVIEDAAQALGAGTPNGPVGTLGDVACFSFFPSKNLGAIGDGGLVTGADIALKRTLETLRVHGTNAPYNHVALGGNFRLDALQAALLQPLSELVPLELQRRCALARQYDAIFMDSGLTQNTVCTCEQSTAQLDESMDAPLGLPVIRNTEMALGHTFNQYVIRLRPTGLREHVMHALRAQNMGCAVYYPRTLADQPALAHLGVMPEDLPHATRAAQEVLALPIHPQLTDREVEAVAHAVLTAIHSFSVH